MSIAVRQLTAADVDAYRDIRLAMLADAPGAFGDAVEDARMRPPAYWQSLLEKQTDRVFLGAFAASRMVGSANIGHAKGRKMQHKCMIFGVYVKPEGRGQGTGRALIHSCIDQARKWRAMQVLLSVGANNKGARNLYESLGFVAYGTEPRALLVDGDFIDEFLMIKHLDAG